MDHQSPSVNLLKKNINYTDKFLSWALTIGRMIIIFTETIALVAFLYRFILDRQLIDQKDRIAQIAAQVRLYEDNEKKFRNLQQRLATISQLTNQATQTKTTLTDVLNQAPQGIVFQTVTVSPESIHLDTNVRSITALRSYVNKIKENPQIASVSIDKIENKTLSATITVGITAKLKKDPKQKQ